MGIVKRLPLPPTNVTRAIAAATIVAAAIPGKTVIEVTSRDPKIWGNGEKAAIISMLAAPAAAGVISGVCVLITGQMRWSLPGVVIGGVLGYKAAHRITGLHIV